MKRTALTLTLLAAGVLLASCASTPSTGPMGFFVTSSNPGKGGDLGGLAGADAHCQKLAAAAGAGSRTWRAYLSISPTRAAGTTPAGAATHARDRIGAGPWFNAKGALIARNVAHLHDGNNISKETALDERGGVVKGVGDAAPIEHDMLTGSRSDGTAFSWHSDTTCRAWTSSTDGSAIVGHHDRLGPNTDNWSKSWNFSHYSAGCSQEALPRTGGSGRFYCFASN